MEEFAKRRFAYRIGDKLPKPIRVIYYIVLVITLFYLLYRFVAFILEMIQKIGSFVFEKKNYYTFITCVFILLIGIFIASQFIFGLDPCGKMINWIIEKWSEFREWCVNLIGG